MWSEEDKYWIYPFIFIGAIIALPFIPFVIIYDFFFPRKEKLPSVVFQRPRQKNPRIKKISERTQ